MSVPIRKPIPEKPSRIAVVDEMHKLLRKRELLQMKKACLRAKKLRPPLKIPPLPKQVDYAPQIPFVRYQGAWGCHQYARAACWDIMNELACPYSPNVSVNRMLWAFIHEVIYKTPIPGPKGSYQNVDQYLVKVGCPTESSEFTDSDGVRTPTWRGNDEASNFRMKGSGGVVSPVIPAGGEVSVDVDTLRYHLTQHPLRVVVNQGSHFVALIGYDDNLQRFKLINSVGDLWGEDGYYYIAYNDLKKEILAADYREFVPPKPMPVARIRIKAGCRQDVYVWLAREGLTWTKRVWPNGQRDDNSRNLSITVTLPSNFQWPPSAQDPLHLEVFSTTEHICAGGDILEFTAANGNQVMPCKDLAQGPVHFEPYTLTKLTIP